MRLYILRHGKAERHAPSGRDEDRPLADRGRDQARHLATLFAAKAPPEELSLRPTLILSSPAARADATARIIAQALDLQLKHDHALALDATFSDLLSLLDRLLDRPGPVLLVGHNPFLSHLIHHLAGAKDLHTGELAVLDLDALSDARELTRFRLED